MRERIEELVEGAFESYWPDDIHETAATKLVTTAVNEALELAARECDQTAKRSERDLYGAVRSAAAIRKLRVE